MILSTSIFHICEKVSVREAIKMVRAAGFDAYDMGLFEMYKNEDSIFNSDRYLQEAKSIRAYADQLGIVCNQAHAPFPSSRGDDERDPIIFQKIVRSMEIASALGAGIIVVHPKQHLTYADHAEELFRINVQFYQSLIPYCEKFGIRVATENMWQRNPASNAITDSTCSRSLEFNKYIDALNSEWITGCLDIGHVSLVTDKLVDFIHDMGRERLQALHVHDTDFIRDRHNLPFAEDIDFHAVAKALGEIDYQGDLTFEIDRFFKKAPVELLPAACRYACEVGRFLISEIEKNRP